MGGPLGRLGAQSGWLASQRGPLGAQREALPMRLAAPLASRLRVVTATLRLRSLPFPLAAPSWPASVPRPPAKKTLGTAYDTAWARQPAARAARAALQDALGQPALWALCRPKVNGFDRLAHLDEPVIFAANHASHLDAPLVLSLLPDRWRHETVVAGASDYFFDTRLKAAISALLINAVPIERQRVSRDSANQVAALLAEGWSLLIFPEGGRSQDGWGQPHRPGAAWLAARTGLPIVPVHVEGTGRILPRGARRPRPSSTRVSFGRPIRPRPGEDPRELAAAVEQAIAALADELSSSWWAATRRAAAGNTPALTGPTAGAWRRSWVLGDRPPRARAGRTPAGAPGGG
jgi:1-acyl-sn-glycerol-3-phosphate acyltransferase